MAEHTMEEYFKKLSERTQASVEDLKAEYADKLAEVKADEKFMGATEEQYSVIARNQFTAEKLRELTSKAIPWQGIVIGIGD